MRTPRAAVALLSGLGLFATGCADDGFSREPFGIAVATLSRAESCEDLESRLKRDAMIKMSAQIDVAVAWAQEMDDRGGLFADAAQDESGDAAGSSGGPMDGNAGGGEEAPSHSETNTQTEGVDEADIVKTDGNFIYLLHGQSFHVVAAWPVSDLSIEASFALEGQPREMFVAGDRVVVYSTVDGAKLYSEAGRKLPTALSDGGNYYGGAMPEDAMWGPAMPFTKLTVLKMNGAQPSLEKELYFPGSYNSSRRVGTQVRTVLTQTQYGPSLELYPTNLSGDADDMVERLETKRLENLTRIVNSNLEDWLPIRLERTGGKLEAMPPSCADYYLPQGGSTQYGLTQVQAIDLAALDVTPREVSIVGAAATVYEGADAMYLASPAWVDPYWGIAPAAALTSTTATHIHKFDVASDPQAPAYVASGTVPGQLLNQFSLDDKDGHLRVATTDQRVSETEWVQENDVFVLAVQGARLAQVGSVRGLAPGESIYSTRFVGDRGYVVTFRQVDPLFVLDLADPTQPKVMAELKIPGFSEYMHPIDDDHLITVGRDGTDDGQVLGLALQLFDVSDATAPKLVDKYVLSEEAWGDSSEAEVNHKAFTFHEGLLAIPYVDYTNGLASSLEVFRIDAAQGITQLGSVDHTGFFTNVDEYGYCGGYYGVGVRRGVFIEDFVYSISYGGVLANAIVDLTTPVASLALPEPTSDSGCGQDY